MKFPNLVYYKKKDNFSIRLWVKTSAQDKENRCH